MPSSPRDSQASNNRSAKSHGDTSPHVGNAAPDGTLDFTATDFAAANSTPFPDDSHLFPENIVTSHPPNSNSSTHPAIDRSMGASELSGERETRELTGREPPCGDRAESTPVPESIPHRHIHAPTLFDESQFQDHEIDTPSFDDSLFDLSRDDDELDAASAALEFAGTDVTEAEHALWGDPQLAELAAQLSADAKFLTFRYPAHAHDERADSERHPHVVSPQPVSPQLDRAVANALTAKPDRLSHDATPAHQGGEQNPRHHAGTNHSRRIRRWSSGVSRVLAPLAILLLLGLLAKPMFDRTFERRDTASVDRISGDSSSLLATTSLGITSQVTTSPGTNSQGATSQGATSRDTVRVGQDEFAMWSSPGQEFPAPSHNLWVTLGVTIPGQSSDEFSSQDAIDMRRRSDVTPVLYQPDVLFHASQAELEGILDFVRPDRDQKIRVAF